MCKSFARATVFAIVSAVAASAFAENPGKLYYDEGSYRPAQIDQQLAHRRAEPRPAGERERALVPEPPKERVKERAAVGSSDGFYNDEGRRVPADLR